MWNVPIEVGDPFGGGQFGRTEGAARGQSLGGVHERPVLRRVGGGCCVHQDGGGVDAAAELAGVLPVVGDDHFGVTAAVVFDVGDRGVEAGCHGDEQLTLLVDGGPVAVLDLAPVGHDGGCGLVTADVDVGPPQRTTESWQQRGGDVGVHEDGVDGQARTSGLGLAVQHDVLGQLWVGGGVEVEVALAGGDLDQGHRCFGDDRGPQAGAHQRDQKDDVTARGDEVAQAR